ncbi:ABC transporter permease [Tellurirhabdus bombi]|uniref:ABC transporter permease n=1 Tax=Tellurirhabdus bombi TaxID=2907205 RepID=UPI001F24D1B5|nr:ABC transporter permease [Tellurirhabdus bombi]
MLQNYFKIAWRNLWRNRLYTSLNIGGLAIGLAACLLMALYVDHEFSYDGFHANADRIVRITSEMKTPEAPLTLASSPVPLATMLKQDYPEVETAVRLTPFEAVVRHEEKLIKEPDIYYADKDVFAVFSYPFLVGNPATALANPNSVVLTERFAKKYFGKTDVLGQTIEFAKQPYQVTGVMADAPSNTDLPVNALLWREFKGVRSWVEDDFPCYTYVLFREQPNLPEFSKKLRQIADKYANPELKKMGAEGYSLTFPVELLKDVHYSQGKMADTPKGNRQYGYLFAFLAVFVLAIALLNYINLLTAKAAERAKEVGVRKANGAQRGQLIRQFLLESALLSGIAIIGAVVLMETVIPFFNELLTIRLYISWAGGLPLLALSWVLITLLGGLYPAFVLSSYRPVDVLKGRFGGYGKGAWLRKSIIVFQFVLSVGMIVGVLVIRRQMDYLQTYDLGLRKEQVLSLYLPDDSTARAGAPALADKLKSRNEIGEVSLGTGLQVGSLLPMASTTILSNGKKRELMSNYLSIDDQFLPLLGIRLKEGRNLSAASKTDLNGSFLVNEAFIRMAGWKEGVGQSMDGFGHKGKVVGVVKNFHYRSLHNPVEPLVLIYNTFPANNLILKLKPEDLPIVQNLWKAHYPNYPFDYKFLEESLAAQYRKEHIMTAVFNGFAALTIVVSCLGLFALTTFTTERRTKEIGIRKVLGASVVSIVALLSKDFLILILIAIFIASPLAWYAMDQWLQSFSYRITISGWIFALAGSLALFTALLTVSFQSLKAAFMNPVRSLKNE